MAERSLALKAGTDINGIVMPDQEELFRAIETNEAVLVDAIDRAKSDDGVISETGQAYLNDL